MVSPVASREVEEAIKIFPAYECVDLLRLDLQLENELVMIWPLFIGIDTTPMVCTVQCS